MVILGVLSAFLIASAQLHTVKGAQPSYEWVSYNPAAERIPQNAIVAGYDVDGAVIYVSQMRVNRERIPSQLIPDKATSYAVFKGDVYKSSLTAISTPILCGSSYSWVYASIGNFPKNAIPCGKTEAGEVLYVGRAEYNGAMVVGSVSPKHSALFATFNETRIQWFASYKVLVSNDVDQWVRASFDDFPEDAVVGGYDKAKREVYVGLVRVGNQIVPAQIRPDENLALASYPGGIEESDNFQVLVGNKYRWTSVKKGKIPENVLIAGRNDEGEPMYVGRVMYKRLMLPGTILASEKILYINYMGKLRTVESGYEVLVRAEEEK